MCSNPLDDFLSLSPSQLKQKQRRQTADHRAIVPYLDLNDQANHTASDIKHSSSVSENITDDEDDCNRAMSNKSSKLTLDARYQYGNSGNPLLSPSSRVRTEKDYVSVLIRKNSFKDEEEAH